MSATKALFLLLNCLSLGALPAAIPLPAARPLHVEGAHLKDPDGNTVVLRGINCARFVDVPDGGWDPPGKPLYSGVGRWDPEVIKGALEDYRRLGFNVVRFHTVVEWWKTNPQSFSDPWRSVHYLQPYRQMMKDTIRWAGERGLYVIFDFYTMKNTEGKQSGQESLPWPPQNRYPEVVTNQLEFVEIWKSVADELGRLPNVLFEFYNEPHGDARAEGEWFDFCQKALNAIRPSTPNPVIVQWDFGCWANLDYPPPQGGASTLAWIERYPLQGSNVVYSTHLYRNSGGGGPGTVHRSNPALVNLWESADVRKGLELTLIPHVLQRLKKPVLVTEIGVYHKAQGEDLEHELLWFKNTLALLNSWGAGYVNWAWESDEALEHGALHQGRPNRAGQLFLEALEADTQR